MRILEFIEAELQKNNSDESKEVLELIKKKIKNEDFDNFIECPSFKGHQVEIVGKGLDYELYECKECNKRFKVAVFKEIVD